MQYRSRFLWDQGVFTAESTPLDKYAPHHWLPSEKPFVPGSPSTPEHSLPERFAFAFISVLLGVTGGLGNAMVTVNLPYLQGYLSADTPQIAWLPAAYYMTYVSMNLILVRFRQQFGLQLFTELFLLLYVLVTFAHLFVNTLDSAIAVRAVHGMVGASLTSLGLFYMIQAWPGKWRLRAVVLGFGSSQLAIPIARMVSMNLLQIDEWRGLYVFELGLALLSFACVFALKLPPGDRSKVFEKMDFLTFILLASGAALFCAVLSLGRIDWWFDAPWIGVASAGSILCICAGLAIERNRARPMLNLQWLGSANIIKLALAVVLIRVVLSEQAIGAVGFLQLFDLQNDQLQTLFAVILLASIAGLVTSAWTIDPAHLMKPLVISLAMMAAGAWMDSSATNLTRASNMYISQFLLAFGGAYFLGPTLITGLGGVIADSRNLVSFTVLFSMTQNIGGLVGSAALGTFQTVREKFHSSQLVEHLASTEPLVAGRVQQAASAYAKVLADPGAQQLAGLRSIATAATREANILAYNDVFLVIAVVATVTMLWIFSRAMWARLNPVKV
jgi:MFS family permease